MMPYDTGTISSILGTALAVVLVLLIKTQVVG
jgi:hypothetical protein